MKTFARLFIVLIVSAAGAMAQNAKSGVSKDTQATSSDREKAAPVVKMESPKQLLGKKFKYDGALIKLTKADNPLQMINPFAPARYGSGFDNLARDPIDGKGTGISLVSIKF